MGLRALFNLHDLEFFRYFSTMSWITLQKYPWIFETNSYLEVWTYNSKENGKVLATSTCFMTLFLDYHFLVDTCKYRDSF